MWKTLAILSLLVALCGCDPNRVSSRVFRELCKDAPAGGDTSGVASNLQERVIAPGMQISVSVAEDSSLNRSYVVPPGCGVDFGAVGRIRVCGLTTAELTVKIKASLERDYFQHATVEVDIDSVVAPDKNGAVDLGVVYVLGAVNRPGPMKLPDLESFTVTKAIVAAGGFTLFASGGNVKVVRYCADGKKYETHLNIASIMKNGDFEDDVPLRPNDWVVVPQKMLSFF